MKMSASLVNGNLNTRDTKGLKLAVVKLITFESLSYCCSNSHLFMSASVDTAVETEGQIWLECDCPCGVVRTSGDIIMCEDFVCADGQRTGHTGAHHRSEPTP